MFRGASPQLRAVSAAAGLGLVLLVCAMVPIGPDALGPIGAVTVSSTYAWGLAARTGGRPFLFGALALLLGTLTVLTDVDWLRSGAAVLTSAAGAVFGVMSTVPARRFIEAARESAIAVALGTTGALAAVGFEPSVSLVRFEYLTLVLSLGGAFVLVYRLGAGLHGLGRRGLVTVVAGGLVLISTVAYAELLRRYGPGGLVDSGLSAVRWSRENLGAFPRPVEAALGVPALAWGCHMRARRRQGWWVCAFGVAATAPAANALMNPAIGLVEAALSVVYGLIVGLVLGWVVIRLDLALTGQRGRRARRAEEQTAVRPEPPRNRALF